VLENDEEDLLDRSVRCEAELFAIQEERNVLYIIKKDLTGLVKSCVGIAF